MGCRDRVTGRQLPSNLFTAHVRGGSFATGPNKQQVRPCPRCRRERKEIQSISGTATGHCGLMEPPWSRLKLRKPSHESCATYSAILNGPPIERFFDKINNVGMSRPNTTNSRPTTWYSSNSHQSEFGCLPMRRRPRSAVLRSLLRPRRALHRRQRFEIFRHRRAILRRQLRGVLDHARHRAAR